MLKNLTIQNYALISHLEIDFDKGFSVITGETGAGKSIILGALSLILGQRADAKVIKQGANKCSIEGVFEISSYHLESFFKERELEYDGTDCILRREIRDSGKSRAFINDTPVSLHDLKELAVCLIDIHSQHQNLLLGNNEFQLQVIDTLAGNKQLKDTYKKTYSDYRKIEKQLIELQEKSRTQSAELDYIRFQFSQLEEAKLQEGEQDTLEKEVEILSHTEEIKTGLYSIEQFLTEDEKGIVISLKSGLNIAESLQKVYPSAKEIAERLQSAYIDLNDLANELNRQNEKMELDPERLQWINDRLSLIYTLQKKHNCSSVEELIILRNSLEQQLQEIDNFDEEVGKLKAKLDQQQKDVLFQAKELSKTRKKTIQSFEKELIAKVSILGMPAMKFVCAVNEKNSPDLTGLDEISFLFSANKNGDLKPVSQTASGGEISRLMLGIKALIAGATALPTIIFDEIDTGVSGEIADKMGIIMKQMGNVMQVIAITHLPQIAAKGNVQYFVYKEEREDYTETSIRQLSDDERTKEIAQMLSGSELTEAAIKNAKELLK